MKRLLALLVASVATTSALPTGQAAEPAAEILSVLDFYGIASCNPSALRGTISWSGTRPFQDGGCAPLPAGVQSVKVTKLVSTCAGRYSPLWSSTTPQREATGLVGARGTKWPVKGAPV